MEADLLELKDKVPAALQSKTVNISGIDFKVKELYVQKDIYSGRPHYVFQLEDPNGKPASKLVLKHFSGNSLYLVADQVLTFNDYERRGLATFLYLYASARLRKPFKRSSNRSDNGTLLWKNKLKSVFKPTGGYASGGLIS
jgi:hypothetical protein